MRELSQSGLYPDQLPPARRGRVRDAPAPGRRARRCWCSASSPPTTRSTSRCDRARELGARATAARPGEIDRQPRAEAERRRRRATPVGAWRHAFLFAPYLRDTLVACGVLSDTFETAITWDRFADFHAEVMETARRAVAERPTPGRGPGSPRVSCRFTHVYPDGPAPYYTVLAPAGAAQRSSSGTRSRRRASEAVIDAGGTITHHHAVGRDHRPWYDRQRPEPFAAALRAAKASSTRAAC